VIIILTWYLILYYINSVYDMIAITMSNICETTVLMMNCTKLLATIIWYIWLSISTSPYHINIVWYILKKNMIRIVCSIRKQQHQYQYQQQQ
jgi:hypothetical protein